MNIVIDEIHFPVRIYTEPPMTDEKLLEVCSMNEQLSIKRETDGGILVDLLNGENEVSQRGKLS